MYWVDYIYYSDAEQIYIQSSAIISEAKNKEDACERARNFQLSNIKIISCVKL